MEKTSNSETFDTFEKSAMKCQSANEYECVLLCGKNCSVDDRLDNITIDKWKSMQEKALKWKGLDTFGNVHSSVDWNKGPTGLYMHNSCYTSLSSCRRLLQSERRLLKSKESLQDTEDAIENRNVSPTEASAPKKLRSSIGTLHDKSLCIWCMKGENSKQNKRDKQLILLSTVDAWNKFKSHTVRLEDTSMRDRLCTLIVSIPDAQTVFGIEIRYHRECWRKIY